MKLICLTGEFVGCCCNFYLMLRGVKANTCCVSADVLGEDSVLKWYQEAHLSKGKRVFLDQMKSFVQWLQNAEEGGFGSFNIIHCFTMFYEFMPSSIHMN